MAETKIIDLTKIAVGSFDPEKLGGKPAQAIKSLILDRAGVPFLDPDNPENPHPLRAAFTVTHMGDQRMCDRVVSPFPPADYSGKLDSAQDWFDAIDAYTITAAQQMQARQDAEDAAAPASQGGRNLGTFEVVNKLFLGDTQPPAEETPPPAESEHAE